MSFDITHTVELFWKFLTTPDGETPTSTYADTDRLLKEFAAKKPSLIRIFHGHVAEFPSSYLTPSEMEAYRQLLQENGVAGERDVRADVVESKRWPAMRSYASGMLRAFINLYVVDDHDRVLFLTTVAKTGAVKQSIEMELEKPDHPLKEQLQEVLKRLLPLASVEAFPAFMSMTTGRLLAVADRYSEAECIRSGFGNILGQYFFNLDSGAYQVKSLGKLETMEIHVALHEQLAQLLDPEHANWVEKVLKPLIRSRVPFSA